MSTIDKSIKEILVLLETLDEYQLRYIHSLLESLFGEH